MYDISVNGWNIIVGFPLDIMTGQSYIINMTDQSHRRIQ